MQYCQYKESCRLQLHVSRHLNPFHPAYMHKKWCRKIDANRQWHGGGPPLSREKSRDVLEQPPEYLLKQEDLQLADASFRDNMTKIGFSIVTN